MTPEQLQAHAAALGYPWVAQDWDGTWLVYHDKPTLNGFTRSVWCCEPRQSAGIYIFVKVTYTGRWQDSLRGPKENK